MFRFATIFLFLGFIQVIFAPLGWGASGSKQSEIQPPFVKTNIEISKEIDKAARRIDVSMTGSKPNDIPNRTQITIRNQASWSEGGIFTYSPHLDLRLHLPNLERKWQLKFITYDENEESLGVNRNRIKTTPLRKNYGGGVGLSQKLGEIQTEFEPRLEYRDQLQLSYFLRFKGSTESRFLRFHPETHLFARSDSGLGEFISLNFDVPIYKTLILTPINEEQYVDRDNSLSVNNGARITFEYDDRMSQGLSLIYESSSRPNYHLDRYTVAADFTHRIHKNILHYTLTPFLAFPRSLDYRVSPGLNFELLIIF